MAQPNLLERPITLSGRTPNVAGVSPAHASAGGDTSLLSPSPEARPRMENGNVSIAEIAELLDCGQVSKAIEMLGNCRRATPPRQNALGVCYLRARRVDGAVATLRPVVTDGSFYLRDDVPTIAKANFTTAVLLSGDLAWGKTLLNSLDDQHPQVQKLKSAYDAWRKGLSWWQRFQLVFGKASEPFRLSFPPGDLVLESDWP